MAKRSANRTPPSAVSQAPAAAEVNSKFEPWLIKHVCEPVLSLVPRSVHPNTISLVNHLLCWTIAGFTLVSTKLDPLGRMFALFGAGFGMFWLMVGDCLDGMQARRTHRCSKLGEMMDHWLDAVHVPMATFGLSVALQLDPWAAAAVHITNAMIYNAQLVLYHRSGRFVHPSTSGADAQFGVALGYAAIGVLLYFVDRRAHWVEVGIAAACAVAVVSQLRLNFFFYVRLKQDVIYHLPFVLCAAAFGVLHVLGVIEQLPFLLLVVFTSFRLTGSFVLFTIIQKPYRGVDVGIGIFAALMAIAGLWLPPIPCGPLTAQALLPYLACLYMIARALFDFARHFSALRPSESR